MEEGGGMNVVFKIDGKIVTPMLTGSILPGVTRRSCLQLFRDWGTCGGGTAHLRGGTV